MGFEQSAPMRLLTNPGAGVRGTTSGSNPSGSDGTSCAVAKCLAACLTAKHGSSNRQFLRGWFTFGDKRPQNGSKSAQAAPATHTGGLTITRPSGEGPCMDRGVPREDPEGDGWSPANSDLPRIRK